MKAKLAKLFLDSYIESNLEYLLEEKEITEEQFKEYKENPPKQIIQNAYGNLADNLHDMCKGDVEDYILGCLKELFNLEELV